MSKTSWNEYAKLVDIKSGNAYKHLAKTHKHPNGGPAMVYIEDAWQAIRIAEKELLGERAELEEKAWRYDDLNK